MTKKHYVRSFGCTLPLFEDSNRARNPPGNCSELLLDQQNKHRAYNPKPCNLPPSGAAKNSIRKTCYYSFSLLMLIYC